MNKINFILVALIANIGSCFAQTSTTPTPPIQRFSAAVYGNPSDVPGHEPMREKANPGWYNTYSAGSKEIVDYLERAGGSPVARKPDIGRVTAFNVHETLEVEPAMNMAQHPLEGFGFMKPNRVGVPYSALPQNRHKFIPAQALEQNIQDNYWKMGKD